MFSHNNCMPFSKCSVLGYVVPSLEHSLCNVSKKEFLISICGVKCLPEFSIKGPLVNLTEID